MTTTITQFFGWKNKDVFDVLINLANGDNLKTNITNLKNKYVALPHGFICEDIPNPETLQTYYVKHCNNKKKPKLIKLLEDETTPHNLLLSLCHCLKTVNEVHAMNLKLMVHQCLLCLYLGDLVTADLCEDETKSFNFPANQLAILHVNPTPTVITCVTTKETTPAPYSNSCEASPVCSKCQCDN